MTEVTMDVASGSNSPQPISGASSEGAGPISTNPPESKPEKLFKQSELNQIVGREKREAVEKYKASIEESQGRPPSYPSSLTIDDVKRTTAEEVERLRNEYQESAIRTSQEQEAKRIAGDFFTKLESGKAKYPDMMKSMEDIDFPQYGNAVQLATMVDNTVDVWNHLVSDPIKLEAINLMASRSPKAAMSTIQKLSASLKENEQAANFKHPNAPLSQLRPSNTGVAEGAMTVSDLRKKYRV